MVPWTQLREPPLWGKCLTDLTFEFTHFILVIRLSKVKQPAVLFCTVLQCPAVPVVPGMPRQISCLSAWSRAEHPETSFAAVSKWQSIMPWQRNQAGTWLAGVVFSLLVSGEVKHIVHLIRWNSYSCFMPSWLTWLPSQQGNNARPLGFGTESCMVKFLFLGIELITAPAIFSSQWTRGRLLLRHPGLLRHLRRHRQLPGFRTPRPCPLLLDLLCRGWRRQQHTINYTHNWWPLTPHPFQFIHLRLATLHTHRTTCLDNLRIFNREYHLPRHLHPRLHHLHHSPRWQLRHIHHQLYLWLHPLCHHPPNRILPVMKFQIPMLHLPSTFHGLLPYFLWPTPSIHQRHPHLPIYTPFSALPLLLHEPTAHVNRKSLHILHPLLATQPWKQLRKSDQTVHQTNLAVHNHRPIHLRLLPSQMRTLCQILLLHPIKPNSQPSPIQLNNFKIHYVSFKLNKLNNNSSCTAPLLHSTNDDLRTNF